MIDHVMLEAIEKWAEIHASEFTTVARDSENKIMFCLPIPGYQADLNAPDGVDNATEAWWAFVQDQMNKPPEEQEKESKYRTRQKAGKTAKMPATLSLITNPQYQYAMSMHEDKSSPYLQPLTLESAQKMKFDEVTGKLYIDGIESSKINLVNFKDNSRISEIDLPTLQALYSIILVDMANDLESIIEATENPQWLARSVKIYLPDFLRMIGLPPNASQDSVKAAIAKIKSFESVIGRTDVKMGKRTMHGFTAVMVFMNYDAEENTIMFASPYINKIIKDVIQASVRRDKRTGEIKRSKKGVPLLEASHSYMIDSDIVKERNKKAIEIVFCVVTLIEQAGDNIPRIKASTIIDRCEGLKQSLENTKQASHKNRLLQSAFKKAWELLEKKTHLKEHYKNIRFPETTPTMGTLDMVFYFPHDGKKK